MNAQGVIEEGRALLMADEFGCVSFSALAVFFFKHGETLLNITDAALRNYLATGPAPSEPPYGQEEQTC